MDKNIIKKLLEESDDELGEKVRKTALAAGLGEKQAGNMTKDSKKLREIISGLKESDVKAVMDLVGEENFMQILKGTKDNPNG
jgi:hypothetical protein